MRKLLLALSVLISPALAVAADLPVKAVPAAAPVICIYGNCSGWYAGFGVIGDGTNADIVGNGINGSVFAAGGAMEVHGGYQLWNGNFLAALEIGAGYEFTTSKSVSVPALNTGGSRFVGQELIRLGYNFFPSSAAAVTTPSQSPVPLTVPANLLAATTPYFVFGGIQRRGKSVWANGAGLETVLASSWTMNVDYLYAPAQDGMDATSIVKLGINKHF